MVTLCLKSPALLLCVCDSHTVAQTHLLSVDNSTDFVGVFDEIAWTVMIDFISCSISFSSLNSDLTSNVFLNVVVIFTHLIFC